jgi:hypothetical protein
MRRSIAGSKKNATDIVSEYENLGTSQRTKSTCWDVTARNKEFGNTAGNVNIGAVRKALCDQDLRKVTFRLGIRHLDSDRG